MSGRARKILLKLAIAAAALLALLALGWALLPRLQFRAIRAAVTAATGQPCRAGSFSSAGRTARDVEIGPEGRPILRLDSVRFWSTSLPYVEGLEIRGLRLSPSGVGEAHAPGLKFSLSGLESLSRAGRGELSVSGEGELAELSPLLEARARVKAVRGRFEVEGRPQVGPGGALEGVLTVTLHDFLLRSADGREVEGAEAVAHLRLSGSLSNPTVDLSELEPYLGRDFPRAFGRSGR
jgi:hypothetical protein